MKKIIFIGISAILILCAVALVALGLRLIQPETHRAGLERAIGEFFKAEARILRIRWVWIQGSPGFELDAVALRSVQSAAQGEGDDAFSAKKIRLVLDLSALLKKELKVRSIRIDQPRLDLTRSSDGLTAGGLSLSSIGRKSEASRGKFSWSIHQILIFGGSLGYQDLTGLLPRKIDLRSVEFKTQPPHPGKALVFQGAAGFLTPIPNTSFEGTFQREADGKSWTAALKKLRLGLEKIPVRALEQAFPELVPLGLRGQFIGAVSGSIERIHHDGKRLMDLVGDVQLEGVKLFVRVFKSPIQDFNASIHFDRDTVVVTSLDGRIADGEFKGRGEVRNLNKPDPDADFEFHADGINLLNLFPRPSDGRPQLTGRVALQMTGKVQGRTREEWLASLQGQGNVAVSEGMLTNINILRLIFDKLATSLPGAQEAFASTMPQDLGQKLSMPDTFLAPVEIPFLVGNGGVVYPDIRIVGDGFEIVGSGQQGFGGDIEFRTTLILDQQVSSYILYCCPDAAAIADSYGRLSLPVRLTGTIRNVRVIPDTQYVIQRIVSIKGPEYLMKALSGKF